MAGTVVLDDVELREAQRDYLDFLDDEVREARVARFLSLEPGEADGPREATPSSAGAGRERPARHANAAAEPAGAGAFHSSFQMLSRRSQSSVGSLLVNLSERSCNFLLSPSDGWVARNLTGFLQGQTKWQSPLGPFGSHSRVS